MSPHVREDVSNPAIHPRPSPRHPHPLSSRQALPRSVGFAPTNLTEYGVEYGPASGTALSNGRANEGTTQSEESAAR